MTLTIALAEAPGPDVRQAIAAPLKALNDLRSGQAHRFGSFALTLSAPGSEDVVGGIWCEVGRGYLHVDLLYVPEAARGSGVGRALLCGAEREGVRRGCQAVWLSSYSFQAPGFYRKLGYRVFGELPDYPPGHRSVFLTKRLASGPG